ncbi:hypothetical protein [Aeromonas phage 14AhydR10PP]|nr:hypothetical protein [Aeromonas phage 14AhydR10PP]
MTPEQYITTAADAKAFVGKKLFWDEISIRYTFLRCGILEEVYRGRLLFDGGNHLPVSNFRNLRTFKDGGEFKKESSK